MLDLNLSIMSAVAMLIKLGKDLSGLSFHISSWCKTGFKNIRKHSTSILRHLSEPSRDWKEGRIKGKENTIQLPEVATHQDSFHCSLLLLWLNPGLSIRHHLLLFICLFTEEFIILWSRKNLKWFLSKIKKAI